MSLPIGLQKLESNPRKRGVSLPNKGARLCGTGPTTAFTEYMTVRWVLPT